MTHEERLARLERILQQVQDQLHETNTNLKQTHYAVVTEVVKLVKDLDAKWNPSNPVAERQEIKVPILTRMGVEEVPLSEVIKAQRDWEVLEFKSIGEWDRVDGMIFSKNEDGTYGDGFRLESMINGNFGSVRDGRFAIHRVRRLSDGVEFAVGDTIADAQNINDTMLCIIKSFSIEGGGANVAVTFTEESPLRDRWLYQIRKVNKKPLFITVDGVGVYEHDKVWYMCAHELCKASAGSGRAPSNECYSTRDAAETAYKAWLYSQRVLSLDDVKSSTWEEVKELVKGRVYK